mmetsp:Transcript_12795/g.31082  ORF Transcript_12795/g.31082 Transcript_12795/m.31082 type:complete len:191 (-) Transcript_12795:189-761(-)
MPPKPTKQVNRNVERRYNNNKKKISFDKSIDFVEEDKKTERRWKQVKESKEQKKMADEDNQALWNQFMDPSNDAIWIQWLNMPHGQNGQYSPQRSVFSYLLRSLDVIPGAQTVMGDLRVALNGHGTYNGLPDKDQIWFGVWVALLKAHGWTRHRVVTPTPSPATSPSRKGPDGGSNQGDGGTGGTGVAAS